MSNPRYVSNNVLAADKALYQGHAIAAVAATTAEIAEEALSLIDVDYEVLPPVLNVVQAMRDDAPLVHERLATMEDAHRADGGHPRGRRRQQGSNVANRFTFEIGDLDKGFQEADVVAEREFDTAPVHQGYIEPHSATALWNADDTLTIWCSSQGHFQIRDLTAMLLGHPVSKIKVVPMEIGGGFGGKTLVYLEPVASVLSRKTGRPVKLSMSRAEVFIGTGPTSGSHMSARIGAKKDGRITAFDVSLVFDAGAFPGSPVVAGAMCCLAGYDLANARIRGYDVVTNKQKTAAYRAPGSPGRLLCGGGGHR